MSEITFAYHVGSVWFRLRWFSDLSLIGITKNHRFLIKITIKIVIRVETHPNLNPHPNLNLFRPSLITAG